ncbi:secretin N-terminal domain-containing protein [Edaphobacter albus]|uniref:secretin N-terminal domain-containing protein n=1 Tax=Edaphobacter sp. 4G125 TaxID=2763071 RepID=UPI0016447692|nr:secretin N-terminal domain-containing protein [Edaphobacter sp. 4G125]QNI36889.1 hypothetical protein H7846_00650 [Edaphobacter sp. 4G125]
MISARSHMSFIAGFALATVLTLNAFAQTSETTLGPQRPPYGPTITRVFHLKNITMQAEANELLMALRNNVDPRDHITLVPSQNAIIMKAPTESIDTAEKVISELDKPRKTYRLIYTLIDFAGTKRVGDQHYSMVLVSGQHAILRQGDKIPIFTGATPKDLQSQVSYIDIGMNFEATIDDAAGVPRLKTKVEQSSVVEDRTSALAQDPIIRQSIFEGSAVLAPGKPLTIGSLDIAGTTRRIEIQATIELLNP